MRNTFYKKILIFGALIIGVGSTLVFAQSVYAITPSLSASATGTGDNVLISINGDANSSVVLNYLNSAGAVQSSVLGNTDSSGNFSATISTATYGISPGSLFAVTVNGQRSGSQTWPYTTSTTVSSVLSLSQTGLTMTVGQTASITANNNSASSLFLSSNSSPSVANVTISGNTITVTANLAGSTTVNVCSLANTANCANFLVTVQSTNVSAITFSQSNVTVPYGQNISVTIGGGTGVYSVVSNSSPTTIQATISGSAVNLYGQASSGSSVITVCSSNMSSCGVINATASSASSSSITFSQNNPSLTPGQVSSVTVSGGTGSYYISSNTNTSVVQTNVVGNTLTLTGNAVGSSVVTVCASTGGCGLINVTVASAGTSISLSQTTATMTVGQILNVSITGAGGYYIQNNTNSTVASASISGNTAIINANSIGTSNITVCQTGGQCSIIYITVTSSSSGSTFSPSPANLTIPVGQTANSALPGSGTYYISNNSSPSVATALVNGSFVAATGVSAGTANITLCQSFGQCAILGVTVTGGASTTSTNTSNTTTPVSSLTLNQVLSVGQGTNLMVSGGSAPYSLSSNSGSVFKAGLTGSVLTLTGVSTGISSINICSANNICATVNVVVVNAGGTSSSGSTNSAANAYKFSSFLSAGSSGKEVTELQTRLKDEGIFTGSVTGYFGHQTETAVKQFQKLHGIDQRGYVGPGTRAELNK